MSHHMLRLTLRLSILSFVCLLVSLAGAAMPADAQLRTAPDPAIAAMIAQVQTSTLLAYANQLTGVTPALIGGAPYTFTTRATDSGEPITKATQFAYEFLQARGLAVSYHNWHACRVANRNVVGEKAGVERPNEIVLVTAHLDSTSDRGLAPGADDDASGAVGVLTAAEILAPYQFQRTLRFVLFTGEEQGLCGSEVYAREAAAAGEAIVAVYNMDMIAWDSDAEPILRLHTRRTNDPGYAADLAIANTFVTVLGQYGLSGVLSPLITPDGSDEDDAFSFWDNGYPAILAIEDDGAVEDDFNPYYHTSADLVSRFNTTYFTNFVKASVGTAATLAGRRTNTFHYVDSYPNSATHGDRHRHATATATNTPTALAPATATATATRTPSARVYLPAVNR